MRKAGKKISLHRETLRNLSGEELNDAKGGIAIIQVTRQVSCFVACAPTANTCLTRCDCPTMVQNCTALC